MCCFIKYDAAGKRAAKNMRPINFLLLSLLIQMLFLRSSYKDLAEMLCYALMLGASCCFHLFWTTSCYP